MTVTAQLADGRTLEFPDGTDPAVVQTTVKKMLAPAEPKTPSDFSTAEVIAGHPATRFALGAASPFIGSFQLGANVGDYLAGKLGLEPSVGKVINQHLAELEQIKRKGMKFYGENSDLSGALGSGVSGGVAVKDIVPAVTYLGKIAQGTAIGAGAGATAPVTDNPANFGREKAIQTGAGATIGAAIPAVTPTLKYAAGLLYDAFHPDAVKGRTLLTAAGDKADAIISLLRKNQEIVPGSAPTAGEAAVPAGRAEFAALQRSAADVKPSEYLARADERNAARVAAVRSVGQDKTALEAAQAARSAESTPLYDAARTGGIPGADLNPVKDKVNLILKNNPGNRELVNELMNVKNGLAEAGNDAQKVSSVLDGLKATIANKDNAFIKGTLTEIKNDLVGAIPGYKAAQAKFASMSPPVNQMQIGQYLESKLTPALDETAKQKAATYAGALRDAPGTIKRSTGSPRFDELSQALTPKQLEVVTSVRDDLARGARFETMAKQGAKAGQGASEMASTAIEQPIGGGVPNFLNRPMMVTNAIIDRLEGKMNRKLAAELAMEMLNPPGIADTMAQEAARQAKNKSVAVLIAKARPGATFGLTQGAISASQQ